MLIEQYNNMANGQTIFAESLREELRLYTRELIDLIQTEHSIDLSDFIEKYSLDQHVANISRCEAFDKLDNGAIQLCMHVVAKGSRYCQRHCCNQTLSTTKSKKLVLEYIRLDKGDFLYDPETLNIYAYKVKDGKPSLLGRLDPLTQTIICC
jgi:hypothetical protein